MRSLILNGTFIASIALMALVSDQASNDALAVSESPEAQKSAPTGQPVGRSESDSSQATLQAHARKIELPVSWQLTRTRLAGASSSTVTETYRETWVLEIQGGGVYQLQSPRSKVPAYVPEDQQSATEVVPTSLTVSETDFGRLIGVRRNDAETATTTGLDRPISIPLTKKKKSETDILLTWSEDEHYSIQLDFSPAVLF